MKGKRLEYTEEDVSRLEEMLAQGHSVRQISHALGRSRHSIASKVVLLTNLAKKRAHADEEWDDDAKLALYGMLHDFKLIV